MLVRVQRRFTLVLIFLILLGCASHFPSGDISEVLAARNATWITTAATGYTPYGGYGSACAHTGAHVLFGSGGSHVVLAALGGVVAKVERCAVNSANDSYVISLAVAMKGSVPVLLEYTFEPSGGKPCSAASGDEDYFKTWIFVEEGDHIEQGQQLSYFTALGAEAHVHLALKSDGAYICPEIFSTSILNDTSRAGTLTGTCGGSAYATGTLCHALSAGEDPSQVLN
jgi:hypothetical protein